MNYPLHICSETLRNAYDEGRADLLKELKRSALNHVKKGRYSEWEDDKTFVKWEYDQSGWLVFIEED